MNPGRILKGLGFALGVLVVWAVIYLYQMIPRHKKPFSKSIDKAVQIVVERAGATVDLRKRGSEWKVVTETGPDYPADEDRVKTLVSGLRGIALEDEISSRDDRLGDFELTKDSGTTIRLYDRKEKTLAEGVFGKQVPDLAHVYFRFPDRPGVFLVRGMIRGELGGTTINEWRRRALVSIPETQFVEILIEGMGFRTDLLRISTDTWTLNGKGIASGPVNTLIGTLAHLQVDDFVDPSASPSLTYEGLSYAKVTVKGLGSPVELRIGRQDDKSKRYPVSIGKDAGLAWLAEYNVSAILQKPSAFKPR